MDAITGVNADQRRLSHSDVIRRVRAYIRSRDFQTGERIGSERALAENLGISRSDLRTALASMESSHEIRRKIGRRGGIVVSDLRLERNINTMESLPVIARRQGFRLSSHVLSASITPASPSDTRLLELSGDQATIYRIERLRLIDGEPLSIELSRLPCEMFPMFLTKDLTSPFYTMFEQDYAIQPTDVDEILESIVADEHYAQLLEVPENSPLIRIRRIARSSDGRPFERATDVYIADRMRFTMHHLGFVRLSATRPTGVKLGESV